jgi:hypothetical protein
VSARRAWRARWLRAAGFVAGSCRRLAQWDRKAFALELDEARRTMPLSESVMKELRSPARY